MDHGIPIETAVREDLLRIARHLGLPALATNDSHYVTEDQVSAHDALLCVETPRLTTRPGSGSAATGYYLRPPRRCGHSITPTTWAEGCANTLLIAERVED